MTFHIGLLLRVITATLAANSADPSGFFPGAITFHVVHALTRTIGCILILMRASARHNFSFCHCLILFEFAERQLGDFENAVFVDLGIIRIFGPKSILDQSFDLATIDWQFCQFVQIRIMIVAKSFGAI
jgi:hypothetical protein